MEQSWQVYIYNNRLNRSVIYQIKNKGGKPRSPKAVAQIK
jgi:hypothetical protein